MAKFVLGIILSIILLMSGLGYDVNYAEARGPDEPCAYTDKHHWLKISYDSQKGEATCKKVDYWVPEKCGIKAGLYKTDASCQLPPAAAEPAPAEPAPAEPKPTPPFTQEEQLESEQKPSVQKNSDSMFLGIMVGIIILGIIGIGILFARKILGGSGGGSDGGYYVTDGGYDDRRKIRSLGGSDDGEYDDSERDEALEEMELRRIEREEALEEKQLRRIERDEALEEKELRRIERDEDLREELEIIRGKLANNRDWIANNENCHSSECDRDRDYHEDRIFGLEHRLEEIRKEKERKERKAFEDDDYD